MADSVGTNLEAGGCLPDFFVIGAAKCGTTSLHVYLDQHPDISMSSVKEPCVFSEPRLWPRHDSYDDLLDCDAPHRGESSTSYTRYPVEGNAAPRIFEAAPHAKLIYLVRDPVDRIVSEYRHAASAGDESRPLNEALRDFTDPENFYVCGSRYATQVKRYLDHFDVSSLLVLEQSELQTRREETVQEVFSFLGVDPDFRSPMFQLELNTADDKASHDNVAGRLRYSLAGRAFRRLPLRYRLPVARAARRVMRAAPEASLDPTLQAALADLLAPEVDELRSITGKQLAGLATPLAG